MKVSSMQEAAAAALLRIAVAMIGCMFLRSTFFVLAKLDNE